MQERRNSIANALELHFSCINPSICDIIAADILVMQGARASAAMVLTKFFRNILVSEPEGLKCNNFLNH